MQATTIQQLYTRDIDKIYKEIESYSNETNLWVLKPGISNSSGNLCLHLMGSMNHFIGAAIGNTGYKREREFEFSQKGISRESLLKTISETKAMITIVLSGLSASELEKQYAFDFAGKHSVEYYLIFFAMHLNYHLGQINYHRRIVEGA